MDALTVLKYASGAVAAGSFVLGIYRASGVERQHRLHDHAREPAE